jgi:carbamoyltransferase
MRILAFHPGLGHDSSAAVFDDYRLIAAVEDERLTRRKGSGLGISWPAIDEVLRIAGWSRADVEAIVTTYSFFPSHYFRYPLHMELLYGVRRWLGTDRTQRGVNSQCRQRGTTDAASLFRSELFLSENGFEPGTPIHFINHHEAHALTALFFTDWDHGLVYTADATGDNVSYSVRTLKDGKLDCHFGDIGWLLKRGLTCNSLGFAYGFATQACGFTMSRHEGKLTGLAAHGKPTLAGAIGRHFWIEDSGLIGADFKDDKVLARTMFDICRGHPKENIAASIQQVTEDLMLASVRTWLRRTGTRHLGLAGGLFANVRLNRLLAEQCPVDEVFIFPAMGDSGISVGAGLSYLMQRDGLPAWLSQRRRLDDVYLGTDYDGAIDDYLGNADGVKRLAGEPAALTSDLLQAGKIGAIYSGRMEYGPRALGARSIIATATDAAINDDLNHRLARSEFMPFAPYVLEDDCEKVFEITPVNRYAARFMTITCAVRPEWHSRIPAVIHVDGTARPQIVRDSENPLYADILRHYRAATGIPVLINTSFNVHEEPIVNRPSECYRALRDARIDFVVTRQAVYTMER